MGKRIACIACIFLLPATLAMAADKPGKGGKAEKVDKEEKVLSGMSIVGNSEAPKALTIVPWKKSESAKKAKLTSDVLNEGMSPVDKSVFMREMEFYKLGNPD